MYGTRDVLNNAISFNVEYVTIFLANLVKSGYFSTVGA